MIVIGDAAHAPAPSSGQGASMAHEDGVVLCNGAARCPDHRGRVRASTRESVASGSSGSSRNAARAAARSPRQVGQVARDAFLRIAFRYLVTRRSIAWMYGHPDRLGCAAREAPVRTPTV